MKNQELTKKLIEAIKDKSNTNFKELFDECFTQENSDEIFLIAAYYNTKSLKFLFDNVDEYSIDIKKILQFKEYQTFRIAAQYDTESLRVLFDYADKDIIKEALQFKEYQIFREAARYSKESLKLLFDNADKDIIKEASQFKEYQIFREAAYKTESLKFLFEKVDQYSIDVNEALSAKDYRLLNKISDKGYFPKSQESMLKYAFSKLSSEKISKISDAELLLKILNNFKISKDLHNFNKVLLLVENKDSLQKALNNLKTEKNLSADIATIIIAHENSFDDKNQNYRNEESIDKIIKDYSKIESAIERAKEQYINSEIVKIEKVLACIKYNNTFKEEISMGIRFGEVAKIAKTLGNIKINKSYLDIIPSYKSQNNKMTEDIKCIITKYILPGQYKNNTTPEIKEILNKVKDFALNDDIAHIANIKNNLKHNEYIAKIEKDIANIKNDIINIIEVYKTGAYIVNYLIYHTY